MGLNPACSKPVLITQGDALRWRMYPFQGKNRQVEPGFHTLKGLHLSAMGNTHREDGGQNHVSNTQGLNPSLQIKFCNDLKDQHQPK